VEVTNCIVEVEAAEKWYFVDKEIHSSEKPLYILVLAFLVTASPEHSHIGRNM